MSADNSVCGIRSISQRHNNACCNATMPQCRKPPVCSPSGASSSGDASLARSQSHTSGRSLLPPPAPDGATSTSFASSSGASGLPAASAGANAPMTLAGCQPSAACRARLLCCAACSPPSLCRRRCSTSHVSTSANDLRHLQACIAGVQCPLHDLALNLRQLCHALPCAPCAKILEETDLSSLERHCSTFTLSWAGGVRSVRAIAVPGERGRAPATLQAARRISARSSRCRRAAASQIRSRKRPRSCCASRSASTRCLSSSSACAVHRQCSLLCRFWLQHVPCVLRAHSTADKWRKSEEQNFREHRPVKQLHV